MIPVLSGDAAAPPQVSRASPTALLSPVTYLGGFFKKKDPKESIFISGPISVMERGGERRLIGRQGVRRDTPGNWRRTHGKVGPAEVRHRTAEMNPGGGESDKPGEGHVMRGKRESGGTSL